MGSFKIGFTSTTFRNHKSLSDVVELAKKAGVDYIEWGGDIHVKSVEDAKKAKELCYKAGIKISSYATYYYVGYSDSKTWEGLCKIASALGADSLRVWLGKKNSQYTNEFEYMKILSDAAYICDVAKKYNLTVCPECHDRTYNNNTYAILKFIKDLNRDNFKTYFQSRYFKLAYDLDRIDKTFEHIKNVHVSYSEVVREQFFKKKNKDYLDIILSEFKKRCFSGIVMLEYTYFGSEKYFIRDIEKLRKY